MTFNHCLVVPYYSYMRLLDAFGECDKRRHLAYNRIESLEGAPIGCCHGRFCGREPRWMCLKVSGKDPNLMVSQLTIIFHHFPAFSPQWPQLGENSPDTPDASGCAGMMHFWGRRHKLNRLDLRLLGVANWWLMSSDFTRLAQLRCQADNI